MNTTRRVVAVGSNTHDERNGFRSRVLRIAEIRPFPRDAKHEASCIGYALDESESGLCLQLEAPVAIGAMLRVVLKDFDGSAVRDEVVSVAWCRPRTGGRFNAGLEIIHDHSDEDLLCVQHASRRAEVAIERPN